MPGECINQRRLRMDRRKKAGTPASDPRPLAHERPERSARRVPAALEVALPDRAGVQKLEVLCIFLFLAFLASCHHVFNDSIIYFINEPGTLHLQIFLG